MSGLLMLKEHVDDTEDLINIELDNRCCPVLMTLVMNHGTALSYNVQGGQPELCHALLTPASDVQSMPVLGPV